MLTIEEVSKAIDRLNRSIDDSVARIHAGYLLIEQMKQQKQQMEVMREKLNELKQMKKDIEKYK